MMDGSDRALLDRYLSRSDDEAFRAVVGRYMDFVHGIARRITENDDLARDVCQLTFIRLAQRAALIPPDITLATWLHRVCRCLAADQVRAESRRKRRELGSTTLHNSMESTPDQCDWTALAPVVDELINRLPAVDRNILLLRYYQNEPHAKVADRLGLTESIARQRAHRAIEKLRVLLRKQGITTSSAALATMLPAHAAPAAPALLAASVFEALQGITPLASNLFIHTLFAVTTTQKAALAGSFLLLFSAVGFTLATNRSNLLAIDSKATSQFPTQSWRSGDRPQSDNRRLRPVPATAEARLERLKEIVAIPNRVELQTQMIAYLDALPPGLFEETASILGKLRANEIRIPVALAFAAWAKADQQEALRFATNPENGFGGEIARNILVEWSSTSPQAALAWAIRSSDPEEHTGDVIWGVARSNPEAVGNLIINLPDGPAKWTAFENLFSSLGEEGNSDPVLLQKIIEGATESQRAVLYGNLSQAMKNEPEKAIAILIEHPEARPFADIVSPYEVWAHRDNSAAIASVEALPPGDMKKDAVSGIVRGTAYSDHQNAIDLMKRFASDLSDGDRSYTLRQIARSHPILALGQLPQFHDEKLKNEAAVEILNPWLSKDPSGANNWLQSNPQPPAVWNQLGK